jgi:glycosyltransferase involved in cell wall biosynthesis
MKTNLKQISLIIATYNEAESIEYVLNELKAYNFFEIIIVDNSSSDKTVDIASNFDVKIINQQNKGWGSAVKEGFDYAKGEYITYMDADGSYNPIAIKEMFKEISKYDFICASRYKFNNKSEDDTIIRSIGNKIFTYIMYRNSLFTFKTKFKVHRYSQQRKKKIWRQNKSKCLY